MKNGQSKKHVIQLRWNQVIQFMTGALLTSVFLLMHNSSTPTNAREMKSRISRLM